MQFFVMSFIYVCPSLYAHFDVRKNWHLDSVSSSVWHIYYQAVCHKFDSQITLIFMEWEPFLVWETCNGLFTADMKTIYFSYLSGFDCRIFSLGKV
jgi:hypothetical protein